MLQLDVRQLRDVDQELKEAVCQALVNLTVDQVAGRGADAEFVFGFNPSRSVVSAQLMPRFDQTDQDDDTSDIRIASAGLDFQVDAQSGDEVEAQPSFSVYVRVMPSWEDLSDEALGLDVDFKILKPIQDQIDTRLRQLRTEYFQKENVERPPWSTMTPPQKVAMRQKRSGLQRQAMLDAYKEFGIRLDGGDEEIQTPDGADADDAQPASGDNDHSARLRVGRLLQRGRDIPTALLAPSHAPPKWKRLRLKISPLKWRINVSAAELGTVLNDYAAALKTEALQQVTTWFATEEGVRTAWRDERVLPDDCRSAEAWNAYLQRVTAQPIPLPLLLPRLDRVRLDVDRTLDFMDPSRASMRVALDNASPTLTKREARTRSDVLFDVSLEVRMPQRIHRALKLDRVEPSYRFRNFLTYDAIGLNCGVERRVDGDTLALSITFAPQFVQPRILPRELEMPIEFGALADEAFPIKNLGELPRAYARWIDAEEKRLTSAVRDGLTPDDADRESARLHSDLAAQRNEVSFIERGIRLLEESQQAFANLKSASTDVERENLKHKAAPYRGWLLTNQTFFERDGGDSKRGWRLFQLAFILAHVPTLASRMEEFRSFQDFGFDEEAASLLYFPTGGGKSEAFYGTLLFAMFIDRLRGKDRGVTALIRYPLRLLTLQQGQRLLKLIARAELVRRRANVGVWSFEIGFWVGGNNTPNRFNEVTADVPEIGLLVNDASLEEGVAGRDAAKEKSAQAYRDFRAAYNKVPECPVCKSMTGLRRVMSEGETARRLSIICFNPKCEYNVAHGKPTPLPFLLTDDAIYARAPAIVLGTIDKLAMIGQHTSTIRQILGMFGLARGIGPTGHLFSPRVEGDTLAVLHEGGYEPVFPAFRAGEHVFKDPFPSLVIQDEAHLLEESLGTFSGLFDSLLETAFRSIDEMCGDELQLARVWTGEHYGAARMPKIIAATATISSPERQLKVLYQRKPLRFPYPGSDLYRSFFAAPAPAPSTNDERAKREHDLPASAAPEQTAPWMRLFTSIMTNGATHTVTAVAVLAAFHTVMSKLWRAMMDVNRRAEALAWLKDAQGRGEDAVWRQRALDRALSAGRESDIVALLDLHRIALAYVTNKKGGDQVMDALDAVVQQKHRLAHEPFVAFPSRLISGGVDMREIQEVMKLAEESIPGQEYPPLETRLRSIVATSAISHGVDVDRFNSMFFAGLPSDIAEYIQASSRVGRTHVGFVMLVPTPQSRRDRYVVETHDIFHRFLERMIAPPAVERWAENAIRRVLASIVQTWAILQENAQFVEAADKDKPRVASYEVTGPITRAARNDVTGLTAEIGAFTLKAIGFDGRNGFGAPVYGDVYRALVEQELTKFGRSMKALEGPMRLQEYWNDSATPLQKPMTSLRDVDEAGVITAGGYDAMSRGTRGVKAEDLIHVMRIIRHQRGAVGELDSDAVGGGAS